MKKLFLISMAATAMLAGCSNDETLDVVQPKAIDFTSFVDKSTKAATDVTTDNLTAISVYGWRSPLDQSPTTIQIFNAQDVTKTNGAWGYTPIQYWEANYKYAFEAIAPKSGEKGVTFTAAQAGGTISFVSDAETDLVYDKVADITTPATLGTMNAVSFTFDHMLSRVKFTFNNGFPSTSIANIDIKDVKITNVHSEGTITPETESYWTPAKNNDQVKVATVAFDVTNNTNLVPSTGTCASEHKYLLPVENASYTVTFKVTLKQGNATTEYDCSSNISISLARGKSYNFVATINPANLGAAPIEFTATVTDWENYTSSDVPDYAPAAQQ